MMNGRMSPLSAFLALLVALAVGPANAQDWKGKGRVEGRVTDQDGKPVAGAAVRIRVPERADQGADVKTDAKGRWAFLGLRGGDWKITIEAEGFMTGETVVSISEVMRGNPVNYSMKPAPKVASSPPAVPPEIAEAVKAGNEALEQKRWTDARTAFEKVLPVAPDNVGLMMALSRSYSGEGNTDKAVGMLRKVTEKEPENWTAWLLQASLLLEKGKLDEGRAALERVPPQSVTDPNVFINVGVLFLNQKKGGEAEKFFTKAIAIAPGQFDGYYYRALARIGEHDNGGARSDLAKVVELAPKDAGEAKEAIELLEALKGSEKK